jgi:hypothetical protein
MQTKTVNGRDYRLSSFTDGVQCVGVDGTKDGVDIVSSNRPADGVLSLSRTNFAAVVAAVKAGRLDHLA